MNKDNAGKGGEQSYRDYVRKRLAEIAPVIEKVSMGEFDRKIDVPEDRADEFTELMVGLNLMIDDLRFMFKENKEKTEALERRFTELSVYNEIGRALGSTLKLDELMKVIYNQTSRVMDTDSFYIALYDDSTRMLSFPLFIDDGNPVEIPPKEFGNGLTEYIINNRQPLLIKQDVPAESRKLGIKTVVEGNPALCWLGVPMINQDTVVGVISVQSSHKPNLYDDDHRRLLASIANQAAGAVANARAYSALERKLTELSVFNEVGTALGSTIDLNELIGVIYTQTSRVLEGDSFYVALYNNDGNSIDFPLYVVDNQQIDMPTRPFGQGLTEYVINQGKPVVFGEDMQDRLQQLGIKSVTHGEEDKPLSWMGVPMISHDKVVGVIGIQSRKPNLYDEDHQRLMASIANQAAGAVANARAFTELERRVGELSAFNEVGTALGSTLKLQERLNLIYKQTRNVMPADHFYVALYTPADNDEGVEAEIEFVFSVEDGRSVKSHKRPYSKGLTEYIIVTREPLLITRDVQQYVTNEGLDLILHGTPAKSWLGVPLIVRNEVIGVMVVQSIEKEGAYDEGHKAFLSSLASQASGAIDNARAYHELEEHLTELSVLNEISRSMSSTLDIEELYRVMYEQIQRLMHAGNFYIALYNQERNEVSFPYAIENGARLISGEGEWTTRRAGHGMTEYVIDTAKPQLIQGDSQVELVKKGVNHIGKVSHSWIGAPMIVRNQVIGIVALQAFSPDIRYTRKDMRFLQMIANQAAPAVENARAYAGLEQRVHERTAELAKSNEALEDFVYTVSHDLKAPLRAILGFSQFLMEDFGSEIPEEGRMYVERMSQSAKRMERLIGDLLELSRVGRIKNPYEETDIDQLVSETVSTLAPGQKVAVYIEGPMPRVICDRVRIGQVFANLISNAIKYNDKEQTEISVGFEERGSEVEFFVADNGPGIEEKYFDKIFKIFQRLTSEAGGTGIGLALVKKIIEDHRGKVWVESQVGQGTTFRFILPKQHETDEEK